MGKTELNQDEFFQELTRIRESKGLGLQDISRRYKIRQSFLEAIESGTFEDLPEPVYAKTFIKAYAGILEVDAGPILARYASYIEKTIPSPAPEAAREESREAVAGDVTLDRPGKPGNRRLWAAALLALVIALGFYFCQGGSKQTVTTGPADRDSLKVPEKPVESRPPDAPPAPPAQQPEAPPAQPASPQPPLPQAVAEEPKKPETPPAPAEKREPPAQAVPASTGGPLSLTLEASEASWVQVRADREPAVQKLLQAGESLRVEAKEKFAVDIGNAGGVQIVYQGQPLGSPGKRGEVVHLIYPEGKRVEKKKSAEPKPAPEE